MNNDLTKVPTEKLIEMMVRLNQGIVEHLILACAILCEMRNRKEWHIFFKNGLYRWCSEIHHGKLHPEFAIMYSGFTSVIKAVIGTPLEDQKVWAMSGEVDLVEITAAYDVVEVRKPLVRFGAVDLETAFGPQGLRSIEEQRVIVQRRIRHIAPVQNADGPRVLVDLNDKMLLINRTRCRPNDLREALGLLGYVLVWKADTPAMHDRPPLDLPPAAPHDARG